VAKQALRSINIYKNHWSLGRLVLEATPTIQLKCLALAAHLKLWKVSHKILFLPPPLEQLPTPPPPAKIWFGVWRFKSLVWGVANFGYNFNYGNRKLLVVNIWECPITSTIFINNTTRSLWPNPIPPSAIIPPRQRFGFGVGMGVPGAPIRVMRVPLQNIANIFSFCLLFKDKRIGSLRSSVHCAWGPPTLIAILAIHINRRLELIL